MKQRFFRFILLLSLGLLTACAAVPGSVETQQAITAGEAQNASTAGSADEAASSVLAPETESVVEAQTAVVYFSGTGNTAGIAQTLARLLDCPIYEIVPEEPYTEADLNYHDDSCRANREMNDTTARPGIASDLSELDGCTTLYLGYPIWWGTAPRIINTFLESYDLSEATIYLFCTSGSSGIERSANDLQAAYPAYQIESGRRFAAGASEESIQTWLNETN